MGSSRWFNRNVQKLVLTTTDNCEVNENLRYTPISVTKKLMCWTSCGVNGFSVWPEFIWYLKFTKCEHFVIISQTKTYLALIGTQPHFVNVPRTFHSLFLNSSKTTPLLCSTKNHHPRIFFQVPSRNVNTHNVTVVRLMFCLPFSSTRPGSRWISTPVDESRTGRDERVVRNWRNLHHRIGVYSEAILTIFMRPSQWVHRAYVGAIQRPRRRPQLTSFRQMWASSTDI